MIKALLKLHSEAVGASPDLGWFFGHCFHKVRNRLESLPMLMENAVLKQLYHRLVATSL